MLYEDRVIFVIQLVRIYLKGMLRYKKCYIEKKKILESLISQGSFELNLLNKIDRKNKCVVMNFSELIYEDEFIMFMRS